MKFKFGKIGVIASSLAIVGVTAGLAAAATFPEPFVEGGVGDVTVVYGADGSDMSHANEIANYLGDMVTVSSSGCPTGGDCKHISTDNNNLNLADTVSSIYTSGLDEDHLPTILENNLAYDTDGGTDGEYDQEFKLSGATFAHLNDDDVLDDDPFLGFDLTSGTLLLNYTLDFTDNADCETSFASCDSTQITIMGKEFFILDVTNGSSSFTMDLFSAGETFSLDEDVSNTFTVDGVDYAIELPIVEDSGEGVCHFVVNGDPMEVTQGESEEIGDEGVFIGVVSAVPASDSGGFCQFSIGSGKIVLTDGQEVEIDDETVTDLTDYSLISHITRSGSELTAINLEWTTEEDLFLYPGMEITMPAFETVKIWQEPSTFPDEEVTAFKNSGTDRIEVETFVEDGDVTLPILFKNSTNTTAYIGLGKDDDNQLLTSSSLNVIFDTDLHDYIVVSWDDGSDEAKSWVLDVSSIDTDDDIKLRSYGADADFLTISNGSSKSKDGVSYTNNAGDDAQNTVNLTIAAETVGHNVYLDRLYTKEGLRMMLPVISAAAGDGYVNISGTTGVASFVMNLTEEDKDGDFVTGQSIEVTLGLNSENEAQVSNIATSQSDTGIETDSEGNSEIFQYYVTSDLATKVLHDQSGDQETAEIYYFGSEVYANVWVGSAGDGGDSSGIPTVDDSGTIPSTNLIVVGGTCVNQVARDLLDMGSSPVCKDDYLAHANRHSQVSADGDWVIETYAHPAGVSGKVATLVYGWSDDGADTGSATDYLLGDDAVGTDVGDVVPA